MIQQADDLFTIYVQYEIDILNNIEAFKQYCLKLYLNYNFFKPSSFNDKIINKLQSYNKSFIINNKVNNDFKFNKFLLLIYYYVSKYNTIISFKSLN